MAHNTAILQFSELNSIEKCNINQNYKGDASHERGNESTTLRHQRTSLTPSNGEDLEGEGQAQDLQVSCKELQNSCLGLKANLSPKDLDGSCDKSINLLVKGSPLLNNTIQVFYLYFSLLLKRKKKNYFLLSTAAQTRSI